MKNLPEEMVEEILSMKSLPEGMIEEILWRLPVKSLLRFRCVSKAWYTLISNPQFSKAHLRHQHKLYEIGHLCPRSIDGPSPKGKLGVDLESHLGLPSKSLLAIVDSCHGLFCIVNCFYRFPPPQASPELILWNPSTRQHHHLPCPDFVPYWGFLLCFFYDSNDEDYKIVRILTVKGMVRTRIDVFTLKTNNWRRIEETHASVIARGGSGSPAYFNGNIHWVASKHYDNDNHKSIVAFSLREEKFQEMQLPVKTRTIPVSYLRVLGGCLCVSGLRYDEFWAMEEYGNKKSWKKLFSLSFPCRDDGDDLDKSFPLALRFIRNDAIMLAHNGKIANCCSIKKECRYMANRSYRSYFQLHKPELGLYMETLVSPSPYGSPNQRTSLLNQQEEEEEEEKEEKEEEKEEDQ